MRPAKRRPEYRRIYIVKVQISLFSSAQAIEVLVYSQDRKLCYKGNVTEEIRAAMDGDLRAFFEAHVSADGKLMLDRKLGEQGW